MKSNPNSSVLIHDCLVAFSLAYTRFITLEHEKRLLLHAAIESEIVGGFDVLVTESAISIAARARFLDDRVGGQLLAKNEEDLEIAALRQSGKDTEWLSLRDASNKIIHSKSAEVKTVNLKSLHGKQLLKRIGHFVKYRQSFTDSIAQKFDADAIADSVEEWKEPTTIIIDMSGEWRGKQWNCALDLLMYLDVLVHRLRENEKDGAVSTSK